MQEVNAKTPGRKGAKKIKKENASDAFSSLRSVLLGSFQKEEHRARSCLRAI
jgi:hypothetical protein